MLTINSVNKVRQHSETRSNFRLAYEGYLLLLGGCDAAMYCMEAETANKNAWC